MTRITTVEMILLAALAISAAGCGDVAYKMGADSNQLRQDREACNASPDAPHCMIDKGWTIANLGGEATQLSPAESTPPISTSATSPSVAAASPQPPSDPLRLIAISGWAKFGGGSPDQALNDCVALLGPAHRPDSAHHQVTAALLGCMKAKNWQAL